MSKAKVQKLDGVVVEVVGVQSCCEEDEGQELGGEEYMSLERQVETPSTMT